jgi:hypothetical protein
VRVKAADRPDDEMDVRPPATNFEDLGSLGLSQGLKA